LIHQPREIIRYRPVPIQAKRRTRATTALMRALSRGMPTARKIPNNRRTPISRGKAQSGRTTWSVLRMLSIILALTTQLGALTATGVDTIIPRPTALGAMMTILPLKFDGATLLLTMSAKE
jgi:hypothetical protein